MPLLARHYVRRPPPLRRVAFASFTGYAVSHNLGFAPLAGAPLRYRFVLGLGPTGHR